MTEDLSVYPGNQNFAELHFRQRFLPGTEGGFMIPAFCDPYSERRIPEAYALALHVLDVPGVETLWVERYSLKIAKGGAFTWEEVEAAIRERVRVFYEARAFSAETAP